MMTSAMGKTQTLKYTLQSRNALSLDETELYELTKLAGITMDPNVFKIILDLLKLNVNPMAVSQMLNSLSGHRRRREEPLEPTRQPPPRSHESGSVRGAANVKGRQPGRQRPNLR